MCGGQVQVQGNHDEYFEIDWDFACRVAERWTRFSKLSLAAQRWEARGYMGGETETA